MKDFKRKVDLIEKNPEIALEAIDLVCDEFIGSGCSRDVYVYGLDPRWVIKIAHSDQEGDNWIEWRIWHNVKHTTDGTKDWFAPCSWISENGRILIQKRTKPLYSREKHIPEKIPAYFTDIKSDNFGWIGRRLVCHDYAHCLERFGYFALKNKMQHFKKILDQH